MDQDRDVGIFFFPSCVKVLDKFTECVFKRPVQEYLFLRRSSSCQGQLVDVLLRTHCSISDVSFTEMLELSPRHLKNIKSVSKI